ncbi:hypothetical protein LCGC14_0936610 [marine sediment metagenome]|uniref:Uncharacterized protein n=1 Tax=marine sediment metagenome TaxID=412755 RepID=A0A0F9RSU3_9ZZZZ
MAVSFDSRGRAIREPTSNLRSSSFSNIGSRVVETPSTRTARILGTRRQDLAEEQLATETSLAERTLGLQEKKFGLLSSTLQKFFSGGVPGAGDFTSAEAPLRSAIQEFRGVGKEAIGTSREVADIFRRGGEFGKGSIAIAEQQARKTEAAGRAGLVASGLSSSTAAIGLKTRVASDLTTAKLGIEEERTGKLATALTGLSALQERTSTTEAAGVAGLQTGIATVRAQAAQTSASLSQALLNSFNFNL